MGNAKQNRIRIAWWAFRITLYVFFGFYFTFKANENGESMGNIIGIALLIIGIVDTFWLFKKVGEK